MEGKNSVGVAVIGTGRIGQLHIENIIRFIPEAELIAIADVNPSSIEHVAKKFAIPTVSTDYLQLLDRSDIEAVVVCSSTDTHAQIIQDSAQAGKHIFCEKPIDLDLERIDQTLKIVDIASVKLQIGFQRRFDMNFRHLKDLLLKDQIGQLHLLRITSRDPAPPPIDYIKLSGGIFLDMMIHDFDMARFITESEVVKVYASGAVLVDPNIGSAGDIDTAVVTLEFANGAIGSIDNSRQAVYGYDQRVEVLGSNGMLQAENDQKHTVAISKTDKIQRSSPPFFFLERYRMAYVDEIKSFIDSIRNDLIPLVTGEDGRAPVVIGLAAQHSLTEKRPVYLTEIENMKSVS